MEAPRPEDPSEDQTPRANPIDWESFYGNYRKPGYVEGFEIVNKLGGGVFGMVFKARKESIGKDYAIKFLKVDDEVVRNAVGRELESVRFFAQIDHPNLVSIEDKGEVDGIPFIVMSYAGQETLRTRLNGGQMTREDALRVFVQAARGVEALHSHSLVHFDLKPANIFLKGEIARVGDYGLSKLVTESRNSLSFGRGTPYYMAPEMLKRRGDARSDVYSLGVILYECLVGDVPFRGDSEWEVLRKHEHEKPEFPEHVTVQDRRIMERCLLKDPDARYQTVEELLRDMQAPVALGESLVILSGRPEPPPIPTAPISKSSVAQRRPEPVPSTGGGTGPAPDPVAGRDPRLSPYGLPWQGELNRPRGILGGFVHLLFRFFELTIAILLLPVRALSFGVGKGAVWVVTAPFRLLGYLARVTGYVFMACLALIVVIGALALLLG